MKSILIIQVLLIVAATCEPIFHDFVKEDEKESNSTVSKTSLIDEVDGFFEGIWNGMSSMWDYITNADSTESTKVENATRVTTTHEPKITKNSTRQIIGDEVPITKKSATKKATTLAPEEDEDYDEAATTRKSPKSKKANDEDEADDDDEE